MEEQLIASAIHASGGKVIDKILNHKVAESNAESNSLLHAFDVGSIMLNNEI